MDKDQNKENQRDVAGRVFQNFGFLTTGKLLGDFSTFLLFVMLSRHFGQEAIGEYSFAMALSGFLMILADYGLSNLSIKEMSRYREKISEYYSEILAIRIFLVSVSLILLVVISYFLPFSERAFQVMILVGSYQIIYTILDGFASIFVAIEKMVYSALFEFSLKTSSALGCILIIFLNGGLVESLTVLPVFTLVHIIIAYACVYKIIGKIGIRLLFSRAKEIIKEANSYATYTLLRQLSTRNDVVFLGLFLSNSAAGIYNVAYRFVFLLLFLPVFGSMSILPIASRKYNHSKQEFINLYNTSLNITVLVGLPVAAGIWVIAPKLVLLVFGEEFSESAEILRLLSVVVFLSFLNIMIGIFHIASDRQPDRTRAQWKCALTNLTCNLCFIPIFGIKGAAYSAIVSELLLSILLFMKFKELVGWPKIAHRLKVSLLGILSFSVPFEIFNTLPLYIIIPGSVIIYTLVLSLFKEVRATEGSFLLSLVKR